MPELGIWDPRIINGIVEKFNVPQSLLGSTLVQHQNHPYSVWNYDIVYTGRTLAGMNTPGSAGSIVSRTRKGTIAGPFAYMREKKIFDPTTLEWLRAPGEVASPAGANAEAAVLREMRDMSNRFDKRIEWMIWQMLQGSLQYSGEGVYLDVDYLVDSTHKPTVAVGWDQPNSEPNANVQAWKRLIAHDGMVAATDVWCNSKTMDLIMRNQRIRGLMSDSQRERCLSEGVITRLLGLDWHEYDLGYLDANGDFHNYIPDNVIIMFSSEMNPFIMLHGPSADEEAPRGFTGRFVKSWLEKDPSGRQFLMEQSVIPILMRPEQIVIATIA